MNNKNIEIIEQIEEIIDRVCFFWDTSKLKPPYLSRQKRYYERLHSLEKVKWHDEEGEYTAEFVVSCSRSHVFAEGVFTKNNEKVGLSVIENSLRRLKLQNM